jgi:hypothetical protein
MGNLSPRHAGLAYTSTLAPKDCESGAIGRGSNMIDTKVILALALLLSTLKIGNKPPAGGIPIPPGAGGSLTVR